MTRVDAHTHAPDARQRAVIAARLQHGNGRKRLKGKGVDALRVVADVTEACGAGSLK